MFKLMKAETVPDYHTGGPSRKYPFPDMQVGEMFFVPHKSTNTLMSLASKTGAKLGRKFETRMVYMRLVDDQWVHCSKEVKGAVLGIGVYRTR